MLVVVLGNGKRNKQKVALIRGTGERVCESDTFHGTVSGKAFYAVDRGRLNVFIMLWPGSSTQPSCGSFRFSQEERRRYSEYSISLTVYTTGI